MQLIRQKREDSKLLERAPQDAEIECEVVAFDELENSQTLSVSQADFAVQNSNYLSVLLCDKEQQQVTTNSFKIFNLNQDGMPCEQTFELS